MQARYKQHTIHYAWVQRYHQLMTEADEPMVFSIAALRMVAITHAGQTQSTAVILFLRGQPSRTADKFWTLHKAMFADGDRSIQQTNPEDHCITILQMATTAYSRQTQKATALLPCRWRQLQTVNNRRTVPRRRSARGGKSRTHLYCLVDDGR